MKVTIIMVLKCITKNIVYEIMIDRKNNQLTSNYLACSSY